MLYFAIATIVLFLSSFIYYYISRKRKEEYVPKEYTSSCFETFIEYNDVRIERIFGGEIRFGPCYYELKFDPLHSYFYNKIFGDWYFIHNDTIYLQQWQSKVKAHAHLVSYNRKEHKVAIVKEDIYSVLWIVKSENDDHLLLDTYGNKWFQFK